MSLKIFTVLPGILERLIRTSFENLADILNRNYVGWLYERDADPSSHDFTVSDFTTDATWNEIDFSTNDLVPQNSKAVKVFLIVKDNAVGSQIYFRKKGRTDVYNCTPLVTTQVANKNICAERTIFLDDERKAEYYATNTTFTTINMTVIGYYLKSK